MRDALRHRSVPRRSVRT
ncbi:hypothetical protein CCL17_17935 [Pseudomonas congelans]|nr:hypothetical protein CCL17_17935 [Pseudomonas congelans]